MRHNPLAPGRSAGRKPTVTPSPHADPDAHPEFEPLERAVLPTTPFYVVIPLVETFTADERAEFEAGRYSLRIFDNLPKYRDFIDFLIERSCDAGTRSQG